jgi:sugar phosphate isomerase/epimerase
MITGRVLHSVSYAGLWGQAFLKADEFVEKAADLGYDGVMLMAKRPHLSVLDYGPAERSRLRAQLEKRGLRHVVLAGYTNFTADLEHGEVPHREFQIAHVAALAELARDIGASVVRVFTGYLNPAASEGAQWNMIVQALRECARRAADCGVTLGVQNHHDIGVGWESYRDLLGQINEPNCKALFDAWAPALQGADCSVAARALGALTVHTTVADYQMRPRYRYEPSLVNYVAETPATVAVPMGEGFIDYREFVSSLIDGGFNGTVAYEMCSPLREGGSMAALDRYARRFLEYSFERAPASGCSLPA